MRSWNSSTASAIRPTGVVDRPCSSSKLHHNRGRGHREAEAKHDRAAAGNAQQRKARPDGKRRKHELQAADAGNVAAQRPQSHQRQFQPDQEQEKQHAEFGERLDLRSVLDGQIANPGKVLGEPTEAVRTDRDADTKEAEHGPDACAVKQRNHKPGSGKKDQCVFQPGPVVQSIPLSHHPQDGLSAAKPITPPQQSAAGQA
jgi:hypothetical protein